MLPKIFADFNNLDRQGRVRFTSGTNKDIERQQINLVPGTRVLLDDGEELSVVGIVEFSKEENIWVAKYDKDELAHR
jgi:hypothetical protein